jgi:hypothetical protein
VDSSGAVGHLPASKIVYAGIIDPFFPDARFIVLSDNQRLHFVSHN